MAEIEVRDILLADFLEEVTCSVVGMQRVYGFLRYCFYPEYALSTSFHVFVAIMSRCVPKMIDKSSLLTKLSYNNMTRDYAPHLTSLIMTTKIVYLTLHITVSD
jgi:hypothetical protein